MAPGVVDLSLKAVADAFHSGKLQSVIAAVGAGRELGHSGKSWIGWLQVGEGRETSVAHGLISVDLRKIRLVQSARPNVLSLQAAGVTHLLFNSQAPLHEVRRMKLAVRNRCDRNRRKTSCRARERRSTGK